MLTLVSSGTIIFTIVSLVALLWSWNIISRSSAAPICSIPLSNLPQNSDTKFKLSSVYHITPGEYEAKWQIESPADLLLYESNGFQTDYKLKSHASKISRLSIRDPNSVLNLIEHSLNYPEIDISNSLDWSIQDVLIPNVTDPQTILQLAKMASNAYAKLPSDPSWRNISNDDSLPDFNSRKKDYFHWDKGGVRGHVFVEDQQQQATDAPLVIIAIKGTTAAGIGGGNSDTETGDDGKSIESDKTNDNLLFSCCCGRVSSLWKTVCDCYESTYTCNLNCLERALRQPDRYYKATLDIYRKVTEDYPNSEVWVTGHSLGGALSALLGRTYGLPVVTFEAPGDMLAVKRLHLPLPPGFPEIYEHVWQFGNNADPIFMGVCNGPSSSCSLAGYAMESMCHSGKKCTYDTVTEKGWHVNMLNHRLKTVIDDLLSKTNVTAQCIKPPPCFDCYDWKFKDHLGDDNKKKYVPSTTSSSSSPSSSPSEPPKKRKCIKYTWYGSCYKWEGDDDDDDDDKKTTITASTTSVASTTTAAKCIAYNWLGICTEYSKATS